MNEDLICFSLRSTSAKLKNGEEKPSLWMAAITGAHQVLITNGVPLGASLKHIIPVSFWRHKGKKSEMQQISIVQNVKLFYKKCFLC